MQNLFCHSRDLSVIPHTLSVIPAKAGIQEVFLSFNIREKNNIDSPLLISGITENENNKEKERKAWIPNQVGDDIGVVFEDDNQLTGFPVKLGMTVTLDSR